MYLYLLEPCKMCGEDKYQRVTSFDAPEYLKLSGKEQGEHIFSCIHCEHHRTITDDELECECRSRFEITFDEDGGTAWPSEAWNGAGGET